MAPATPTTSVATCACLVRRLSEQDAYDCILYTGFRFWRRRVVSVEPPSFEMLIRDLYMAGDAWFQLPITNPL